MNEGVEKEVTNPAAKLTVFHQDEGDYTARIIHLSLDGREIASLSSGKSVTLVIKAGRHVLQADNTFTKKKETFEAGPGDELRYVTRNRTGFGSSLIFFLGAGPLYLILKRETEPARQG